MKLHLNTSLRSYLLSAFAVVSGLFPTVGTATVATGAFALAFVGQVRADESTDETTGENTEETTGSTIAVDSGSTITFDNDAATGGEQDTLMLNGGRFYQTAMSGNLSFLAGTVHVVDGTTTEMDGFAAVSSYTFVGDFTGAGTMNIRPEARVIFTGSLTGFTGTLAAQTRNSTLTFGDGGEYSSAGESHHIFGEGASLGAANSNKETLVFNYSNESLVMNATLAGNAALKQQGSGELVLAQTFTSTGTLTVANGSVSLGTVDAAADWAGAIAVNAGSLKLVNVADGALGSITTVAGSTVEVHQDGLTLGSVTGSGLVRVVEGGTLNLNTSLGAKLTADAGGAVRVLVDDEMLYLSSFYGAGTLDLNGKQLIIKNVIESGTTLTVNEGEKLTLGGMTAGNVVIVEQGGKLVVDKSKSSGGTMAGTIAGTGEVEFTRAGSAMAVSGDNSAFAGTMTIIDGTSSNAVQFMSDEATGGANTTLVLNEGRFFHNVNGGTFLAGKVKVTEGTINMLDGGAGYSYTFAGNITDSGTLELNPGATLKFTGSMAEFCGTLQNAGHRDDRDYTFVFGNGGLASTAEGSTHIFGEGATLASKTGMDEVVNYIFNYSNDSLTMNAALLGDVNLKQQGSGELVLAQSSDSTGTLTVANGSVTLGTADTAVDWDGAIAVNAGSLKLVNVEDSALGSVTTVAGSTVAVQQDGLTLASYSGTGSLNFDGLHLTITSVTGSGTALAVTDGSKLTLGGMINNGSVAVAEGGTLEVNGSLTASVTAEAGSTVTVLVDGLTISSFSGEGALDFDGKSLTINSVSSREQLAVTKGSTLTLGGMNSGSVNVAKGGTLNVRKSGLGTLAASLTGEGDVEFKRASDAIKVSGDNSAFAGTMTITGGTSSNAAAFMSDEATGGENTTLVLDNGRFYHNNSDGGTFLAGTVEVKEGTDNRLDGSSGNSNSYTFVGDFTGSGTLAVIPGVTVNFTGSMVGFSGTLLNADDRDNSDFTFAFGDGGACTTASGNKMFGEGATLGSMSGTSETVTLAFNYSNDVTMNAALQGRVNVRQQGSGTLVIDQTLSSSVNLAATSGTLELASSAGAQFNLLSLSGGANFVSGDGSVVHEAVRVTVGAGEHTLTGKLTVTTSIEQVANGSVLNISGANTVVTAERYFGTDASGAATTLNVTDGATLCISGSNWESAYNSLRAEAAFLLGHWPSTGTLNITDGGTVNLLNAGISVKDGSGVISVGNGGTLNIHTLGVNVNNKVSVSLEEGGTINIGAGGIRNNFSSLTIAGGTLGLLSGTAAWEAEGNITLSGDLTINTELYDATTGTYTGESGNMTFNGTLNAAGHDIVKLGEGALTLSGVSNLGSVEIQGGCLSFSEEGGYVLDATRTLTFMGEATFESDLTLDGGTLVLMAGAPVSLGGKTLSFGEAKTQLMLASAMALALDVEAAAREELTLLSDVVLADSTAFEGEGALASDYFSGLDEEAYANARLVYTEGALKLTFDASETVPEPTTAALSLLALATLAARRRRKG